MSMIGSYKRVSAATLDELLADPDKISEVIELEEEDGTGFFDIDKAWHIIHFLLNDDPWKGPWPTVGAVLGGTELSEEEVGYGPARYLTPPQVAEVAAALADIPGSTLWSRFDVARIQAADIYPKGWTAGDAPYVLEHYSSLQKYLRDAAQAGDGMILYLS